MTMTDDFLKFEIDQILYLQNNLKGIEPYLASIHHQFSPINVQFILGPLITVLTGESLAEVIVAMAVSDYVAQMMKWVIGESRPFWWIRESTMYSTKRPRLQQHSVTCSTTGGSPSGHASIATVILYMQGRWLVNYLQTKTNVSRSVWNGIIFTLVSVAIVFTWISSAYFGANFIHQGLTGTTLALATISFIEQDEIKKGMFSSGKRGAISLAVLAGIVVGGVFAGMLQMGVDPMWSVRLAFKWCESVDFLKPETTPMYNIVRNLGSILGIALCAPLREKLAPSSNMWKSIPLNVAFVKLNTFLLTKTPKDSGSVAFLLWTFGVSAFHSYGLIDFVPRVVNWTEDIWSRQKVARQNAAIIKGAEKKKNSMSTQTESRVKDGEKMFSRKILKL